MFSMLLDPPLETGITWSAVSFLRLPQHKQRLWHCLHKAFHSAAVKEPPALVRRVRRVALNALVFSGCSF